MLLVFTDVTVRLILGYPIFFNVQQYYLLRLIFVPFQKYCNTLKYSIIKSIAHIKNSCLFTIIL